MDELLFEIGDGTLKPAGWNLGDVRWRRRAFIAIHFPGGRMERGNAVTFTYKPDGGNHAFRDGKDLPEGNGDVETFFCLNHMSKFGSENDSVGETAEAFEIRLNHPHPQRSHVDTGTNTGPPLP